MILPRVLEGRRVVVCAGAGGVGKTTVAAALGSELASRGGRVLVLTIDPARRLAGALGLPDHGDDVHAVDLVLDGSGPAGSLHAAMLDAQLTFDRLVREQAPSERAAERILANRDLPSGVGGGRRRARVHGDGAAVRAAHERRVRRDRARHAAVAERARLPRSARPADAVRRGAGAASSCCGRECAPGRLGFSAVERIAGVTFLRDLSELAAGFEGMYEGFARRASEVSALLASERTTFLLVTVPQVEPLAEADFFWRALRERELPFGGMIVNKVHPSYVGGAPAARTRLRAKTKRALRDAGVPDPTAGRAAENLVHYQALADRDRENIASLERRIGSGPIVEVPLLDHDVHDLEGVAAVGRHLFAARAASG